MDEQLLTEIYMPQIDAIRRRTARVKARADMLQREWNAILHEGKPFTAEEFFEVIQGIEELPDLLKDVRHSLNAIVEEYHAAQKSGAMPTLAQLESHGGVTTITQVNKVGPGKYIAVKVKRKRRPLAYATPDGQVLKVLAYPEDFH